MRELDMARIIFCKTDRLLLQSLLLWQALFRDELYSIVRLKFVHVSLLGASAHAGHVRTSRDGDYLSSYHRRRNILVYPRPGLTGRDFRGRSTYWNPVPCVLSQGASSNESLDLIL